MAAAGPRCPPGGAGRGGARAPPQPRPGGRCCRCCRCCCCWGRPRGRGCPPASAPPTTSTTSTASTALCPSPSTACPSSPAAGTVSGRPPRCAPTARASRVCGPGPAPRPPARAPPFRPHPLLSPTLSVITTLPWPHLLLLPACLLPFLFPLPVTSLSVLSCFLPSSPVPRFSPSRLLHLCLVPFLQLVYLPAASSHLPSAGAASLHPIIFLSLSPYLPSVSLVISCL